MLLGVVLWLGILIIPGVLGIRIISDPSVVANKSFSYVVVGGGTAGLAVAIRLAENPGFSVLVLEAGPDAQNDSLVNNPSQTIPAAAVYDWHYNTTAQQVGANVLVMTQGKVLGGSSSINGMCWTRATVDQYDSFERLGNPGWNFAYMKKSERYHVPGLQQTLLGARVDPAAHGFIGNVDAGFPQPYEVTTAAQRFTDAVRTAIPGLIENPDVASGAPNGAARFQFSIKPGNSTVATSTGNIRSSSANAYIYPSLQEKPNLIILTGHQGTTIVWGKRSGGLSQATGVRFIATPIVNEKPGSEFTVKVKNEVIIASGAIGSPHFLELSGVGDRRILKQVGIPIEVDLPSVGTNLQDQALNSFIYAVPPDTPPSEYVSINAPLNPAVAFVDIKQVLGTHAARSAGRSLVDSIPARAKELVSTGAFTSEEGLVKVLKAQARSIVELGAPVIEYSLFVSQPESGLSGLIGIFFWNLLPQWRGTVHVKSKNPSVHPALDPQYFTGSELDLALKVEASRIARRIFATSPLKEFVSAELSPTLDAIPRNASDAQWQEYVKSTYSPVLHPIGSVPMLPRKDGGAVGPDLIVYGTANVRVVDSSIIPVQLSAHLSATVYGIAEKAADMIKESAP
ncbi:alcohol oxidase [Lyophyllum atratum]|nr:alcohol oxidase [Lyophyllum atratum]